MSQKLTESAEKTKQQINHRQLNSAPTRSLQGGYHSAILQLQRTLGNRRVAQLIQTRRITSEGKIIGLQSKLTVGAADDQYEQEADQVARQVVSMPDSVAMAPLQQTSLVEGEASHAQTLRSKPLSLAASITPFVQRHVGEDCSEPRPIQGNSTGSLAHSFEAGDDIESQLNQSKGGGSQLPDSVRAYMEPRFGLDFSHVRAHTGSDAITMNQGIGAQAFTHGADIYYGAGTNPSNMGLTAHELTHVVQQTGSAPLQTRRSGKKSSGDPNFSLQPQRLKPADILDLQRLYGNRAVQRLLAKRTDHAGVRDANGGAGKLGEHTVARSPDAGRLRRKDSGVKLGQPVISTDREAARLKGRELQEIMSSGKLDSKTEEQMTHWLSFFEGEALAEFISYVSPSGNESLFGGEMAYPPDKDRVAVEPGSMVIPKSEPREARGGFSVSFYAQAYNEDSQSTSVEVYTDLSVGGEVGVELPIKKVAKFKFSASAKKGRKTTDKQESKETNRAGMSITRTYKVIKLERDIFKADFVKTMHGISKPSGNPLALPASQLPSKVSSRVTGISPQEIQSGYKIVPSEGGPPWGPLWNTYADQSSVEGSALDNVKEILINEKLELAKILAFEGAD